RVIAGAACDITLSLIHYWHVNPGQGGAALLPAACDRALYVDFATVQGRKNDFGGAADQPRRELDAG
ncbi:MAG TPA: hypothetical protein VN833_04635, partial [Candidatus Acidoferrales bacterium]|nr:hypothetical protein [Candidatus Acidoferrales bacterium]